LGLFCQKIVSFAAKLGVNLHFMKVSTENDNNFGYEKITILVDNIPLSKNIYNKMKKWKNINLYQKLALMKYR
jgi:hypothetical protein